ncbi:MAG: L-histidine N(alpha)-methyltransferase [Candidatus Hodarchaeales archaeon]|jgi:dimethylhistidine N-methyltransferase
MSGISSTTEKKSKFRVLEHKDLEKASTSFNEFARDVFIGLNKSPKHLSSKYFYDDKGSKIYEEIMKLPEYYLVRSEAEILETFSNDFADLVAKGPFHLIELGAGNGEKTSVLLQNFVKNNLDFEYVPIDISHSAMEDLINKLNVEIPELRTQGFVAEYFNALKWLSEHDKTKRNLVLFLGSNIGNFMYSEAKEFLFHLWHSLNDGDLVLIGFDLRKNIDIMSAAYNDSKHITKSFNMNLLERINNELGGEFDLEKFKHYEPFNVYSGAMESYLVSQEDQEIYIKALKRLFHFEKFEPIFMEQSFKYLEKDIKKLAKVTGYEIVENFYCKNRYFCDSVWKVVKKE